MRNDILIVTVVAAAVRLLYVVAYPQIETPCPDCGMYDNVANNLIGGHGLVYDDAEATELGIAGPVSTFGPVYPVFLAAIYEVAGHRYAAVRIVQALLGALLVPVAWQLMSLAFGPAAARVGAWLIALSPPLIAYCGMLLTENLSTLLLLCAIWLFVVGAAKQSAAAYAASAVATGLLILLREEMLAAVAALLLVAAWKGSRVIRIKHVALYLVTAMACVAVWTARNYAVFHAPILVTTKAGEQLYISARGWKEWQFDDPSYRALVAGHTLSDRDRILRRDAIRIIREEPQRYLTQSMARVAELWLTSHTSYVHGLSESYAAYRSRGAYLRIAAKAVLFALQLGLLTLGLFGAVRGFRSRRLWFAALMTAVPVMVVTAVHFVFLATARYQIPVLPFVFAFAGVAIADWIFPDETTGAATVSRIA